MAVATELPAEARALGLASPAMFRRLSTVLIVVALSLIATWSNALAPAQTLPTVTVTVGRDGGRLTGCPDGTVISFSDPSFVVKATGAITQPVEVSLSWGGTAVPGVDSPALPTSVELTPSTPEVTISPGWNGQRGVGFTLTVIPGGGYTVGDPNTASPLMLSAGPGCAVPPGPPPPIEQSPSFTG
jgi:hypothetical protein